MLNGLKKIDGCRSSNVGLYLNASEDVLYKIYTNSDTFDLDIVERNIKFLKEHNLFRPRVIDILYDENGFFIGYSQEYIRDAKTFVDGISDENLTMERKFEIIYNVFRSIRKIHSYCGWIGDVHSRNLLYTDEGGFLIDLDDLRFDRDDNMPLSELYYVYEDYDSSYLESSPRTDNIKATLSALSVLYGFEFEDIIYDKSLHEIMTYLSYFTDDDELLEDFKKIFFDKDNILYFDDVLRKRFSNKILVKNEDN